LRNSYQYGRRGLAEIDFGRARWQEDPTALMQALQSYLRIDDERQAPDAVFKRGELVAAEAQAKLENAVRRMPGGAFRVRLVRFLAGRLRSLLGLRESPKFFIVRLMGILREGLLDSGRELASAGVLARADDIFFMHLNELDELARGPSRDWRTMIAGRRAVFQREKLRRQIPRLLLSDGRAFYEGMGEAPVEEGEGVLVGSPVSPGVAEGLVRVVFDPHQTQLSPGEILVCPGTDPAWTPLFLAAAGLVMEVGGLMTHGSVVAREYGIPAVVGVHEATTRLKTGQRIRVDGNTGRVRLLPV
jgi:pyruvate,water dikinase